MKKLFFSLFVLSILFAFTACGSDDDDQEQKFFTGDCKQTVLLEWSQANSTTTTATVKSTLDDMLKNSPGYGSPVSSGELLIAGSNTDVKIAGLPEGTALKDFKININGIEQNFGEISNEKSNLNLWTDKNADFFKRAFNKMVSEKKLETKVTFTATTVGVEGVRLEIVFNGRFSYWVKI